MKQDNIDHGIEFDFGRTAMDYSKYRDIYPNSLYEKLYERGIGHGGQKILDLGTGTGVFPRAMYKYGAEYTGIDISEEQIKYAELLSKEQNMNIAYKVCPAESTGLAPNEYDAITSVQSFIYFDTVKLIPEMKRVLKKDGRVVTAWMTWLPHESKVAEETEKLVLKYNPKWTGAGYKRLPNNEPPEWAEGAFEIEETIDYVENIRFTYETWAGRIRACRGVSAALPENTVKEFDEEHLKSLKEITEEPFGIVHEIKAIIFSGSLKI
jgi:ubiquinone/menaquinone biosynthesis C-methylase UbiE